MRKQRNVEKKLKVNCPSCRCLAIIYTTKVAIRNVLIHLWKSSESHIQAPSELPMHDPHGNLYLSPIHRNLYTKFSVIVWSSSLDKYFHLPLADDFRFPSGVARCDFLFDVDGRFISISMGSTFEFEASALTRPDVARNFFNGASLTDTTNLSYQNEI